MEKFSRIVLDFRGVETVGQGFVDEIFRVFQEKNPAIQISYRHANDNVLFMIKRGFTAIDLSVEIFSVRTRALGRGQFCRAFSPSR